MTSDANWAGAKSSPEHAQVATDASRDVVSFGEFAAHLRSAELFRGGVPVKIQLQPFRVLAALLRRPGELVTREELRLEVWGDHTAVDFEHGLNFCIKQVRAALGDNADEPSFVATLPRRGYRFIAPVATTLAPPSAQAASSSGHGEPTREGAASDPATTPLRGPDTRAEAQSRRPNRALPWLLGVGGVTLAFTLAASVLRVRSQPGPPPPPVLFVLPFQNLTGEHASDVWCEGLTEETIADLASADPAHVQVIARTTSMAYRSSKKTLREIGSEVKAEYALEGAVRKDGAHLRVTAQLYRVREGTPVWARAFEATASDLLDVQRRLASELANSLALRFEPDRPRAAASVAAQDALAKARYLHNKHDTAAVLPSLTAYEEAILLDPQNGRAMSELAMAYQDAVGVMPAAEAIAKSCALAERASVQSPREALADTVLGLCALQRDWDGILAARAFESAVAKNPGLAAAHHAFAAFLSAAGRHEEAMRAIERAKSLDPLSPAIVADAGWHAYLGRNYPVAIREFERTLELEPDDKWTREHLMTARSLAGDVAGAAREAVLWVSTFPFSDETKGALAALPANEIVARASGEVAQWLTLRSASGKEVNPGFIAMKYAGAGEKEPTLLWLERAASERAPWFLPLLHDPRLDFVLKEPRFLAILTKVRVSSGAAPR